MSEAIKKVQLAISLANNTSCEQIEIAKVVAMAAQAMAIAELAEAVKSTSFSFNIPPLAAPVQYVPPSLGESIPLTPGQTGFPPYITCGEGLQPGEINTTVSGTNGKSVYPLIHDERIIGDDS